MLATHDRLMRDVKRTCGGCTHERARSAGGMAGRQVREAEQTHERQPQTPRRWRQRLHLPQLPTLSGYDSSQ